MAKAKICDRCGAIFKDSLFGKRGIDKFEGLLRDWYDLCPDCLRDFDEWMDQKHTEKNVASNG